MEAVIAAPTEPLTHYDRLAQVFSRVYAETGSIATTLEVLDTQRAREAVARPAPDFPNRVLAIAASLFHVAPARLLRPGRHRDICSARWIAAWMLRRRNWSTLKIGRFLGLDHSTVLHGLRRVAESTDLLLAAREAEDAIDNKSISAAAQAAARESSSTTFKHQNMNPNRTEFVDEKSGRARPSRHPGSRFAMLRHGQVPEGGGGSGPEAVSRVGRG